MIRHLSAILPAQCLRTLYYAYYHSHISYGLSIWYPMLKRAEALNLYKMQKCVVRRICNAPPRSHCMPLFRSERISTIPDLVTIENCKPIHRVVNHRCAKPITHFFARAEQPISQQTRSLNVVIPKHNLAIINQSFLCKPVSDWSR